MKYIQSNSKDTFIFWLREMKNVLIREQRFRMYHTQNMWLTILKNKMENQQVTLQEAFNDIYKIALVGDEKKIVPKLYKI